MHVQAGFTVSLIYFIKLKLRQTYSRSVNKSDIFYLF